MQLQSLPTSPTIAAMSVVEANVPLDHAAAATTAATLWTWAGLEPKVQASGTLAEVNQTTRKLDSELAALIRTGQVSAIVLASAHFGADGTNSAVLRAAVETQTPCLGTGGTCMGQAVEAGALVLALGGSVSTTADSRALAAAAAMARHWRLRFSPRLPAPEVDVMPCLDAVLPFVLSLSLMHTCLPAFLAAVLSPRSLWHSRVATLLAQASDFAVPTALAAVASRRAAQLGEAEGVLSGILAGVLTSAASSLRLPEGSGYPDGGHSSAACAALAAGIVAGLAARTALVSTHAVGLPATASTLVTVGGAGVVGGGFGAALSPVSSAISTLVVSAIRHPCHASLSLELRLVSGALLGMLTKWGSINGFYHSIHFPLILLEMEHGAFALAGAFDACCLAFVCAGVCAAVALTSAKPAESAASARAVGINMMFGDYVEACYAYMDRSRAVNAAAYAGAALAGATLLSAGDAPAPPRSSAYLPLPLAVFVSDQPWALARAAAFAFVVPFAGSFAALWRA